LAPQAALVFKVEQVFARVQVDYTKAYAAIDATGVKPKPFEVRDIRTSMRRAKQRLSPKAYGQLKSKVEALAEELEGGALKEAKPFPGVAIGLAAARRPEWMVAAVSDFAMKPVREFLELNSLAAFDLVAARSRVDEAKSLKNRLRPLKKSLKTLERSAYFCNTSSGVLEAKSLGMKCFALPNRAEPFSSLLAARPDGLILSLEELPQLLDLPSMKFPETGAAPAAAVPDAKQV
jgi:beta-phosphoglucomutase-like phosphatase (HAD superfamily)